MRWFWIVDINLNEPANLFQLLGQPQADRESLTVSLFYLYVCLFACLSACILHTCLSFCFYSSLIYANGSYTVSNKNTSALADLFVFVC